MRERVTGRVKTKYFKSTEFILKSTFCFFGEKKTIKPHQIRVYIQIHIPNRRKSINQPMAALQYLDSLRTTHPELSDWYNTLADLYERKLWHQLTLKLEQFVALAVFQVYFIVKLSL